MYVLKLLLAIAFAVLVHLVGARLLPEFPRLLDVFLVVVALHALSGNSLAALLVGLAVGVLQDTLTGNLYGLHGIADTIVGYSTARLAQRLVIQRATGVLLVVAFASLLQQALVVVLVFVLLPEPPLPEPLWVGIKAVASGGVAMLVYIVAEKMSKSYESRRRGRMNRLRLG